MKGLAACAAAAAIAVLLSALPQVDLTVSGWFYDPPHGFALGDWAPFRLIYRLIPWITWAIVLVVIIGAAWLFLMQRPLWRFDRKALLFIVFSTALGPGLIANAILKDHWGRARPIQIEAFGGTHRFTAAPLPAAECTRNCAFVSGHAALGFSLVAFALLLPAGKARQRAAAAVLGFGALVGLIRIVQGGHFLSDVVWAGLLVFGTTALVYWLVVVKDVFAAPAARSVYRGAGRAVASVWRWLAATEAARITGTGLLAALLVVASITLIDRPVAVYVHSDDPGLRALFTGIGSLGEAWPWLVLFGLSFAALHWGGELPRLRAVAAAMRVRSAVPAFLFASIALAGLATDIVKIGLGRMRPKLLFASDLYGFTGLAWRPDHWSFPSGHAATFVALMAALWWLWPRHLLFYVFAALIVAASRIIVGAHYPSDVFAGAFVAILATRSAVWIFARWGVDVVTARRGENNLRGIPPWPCRCFRRLTVHPGRRAGTDPGPSLASAASGVVSPHHGTADRDV